MLAVQSSYQKRNVQTINIKVVFNNHISYDAPNLDHISNISSFGKISLYSTTPQSSATAYTVEKHQLHNSETSKQNKERIVQPMNIPWQGSTLYMSK